jgi:hypothetical protein
MVRTDIGLKLAKSPVSLSLDVRKSAHYLIASRALPLWPDVHWYLLDLRRLKRKHLGGSRDKIEPKEWPEGTGAQLIAVSTPANLFAHERVEWKRIQKNRRTEERDPAEVAT